MKATVCLSRVDARVDCVNRYDVTLESELVKVMIQDVHASRVAACLKGTVRVTIETLED